MIGFCNSISHTTQFLQLFGNFQPCKSFAQTKKEYGVLTRKPSRQSDMMEQQSKEFKLLQKIQQPKKGKAATTSHGFGLIAVDFYAHISAIYNLETKQEYHLAFEWPSNENSNRHIR